MIKKLFLLLIIISLYSCQSVKDALSGKKYESSDEFLVIKKNPLVVPPDFEKMPIPKNEIEKTKSEVRVVAAKIKLINPKAWNTFFNK